jgi:crotonobetainyl-CoA:carnitine CoA-transferase CaiB-like acyl-CoA transferase
MSSIGEGLNVVEMGCGSVAASILGMVLADAGARVIKVEPPEGDLLRSQNPSGFLVWNRGKESQVVDLRTSAGQATLQALSAGADIVIEAFGPGVARAWGVGAEALRAANPGLIYCDISGFGDKGPYRGLKAYDAVVAAKLGLWSRGAFSFRDGPLYRPVAWASFGAAMQAVAGVMGALLSRETTGLGCTVSANLASGLEPIDYFMATVLQLTAKYQAEAKKRTASPAAISRYGVLLVTKDGRLIQTSTVQPHQGQALCKVAGIEALTAEPRFARLPMFDTVEDAQAWEDLLLEAFLKEPLEHWLPLLEANADIAFEVARTSEEGLDHPQIIHNGDVITIEDPVLGPVRQVGPLGHFSESPSVPRQSSPALGVHRGPLAARPARTASPSASVYPFEGVTILEFGYFYAMPYGLAMMAALGARVIKIEDKRGDPHRISFGEEVASAKTTAGKESLSIDLQTPEGRKILHALAAKADVFVTGFRSGVSEKLGLGYDELKALNPRLLYVHAAGYGSDGPYAHRALYAQAAQAVAGSFGRQVGHWSDPERVKGWSVPELQAIVFPHLHQVIDGDSSPSLAVMAAIAMGLYHQRKTGRGQRLNTSMIAANALAYSDDFCSYPSKPAVPLCDEEDYGVSALERLYPAASGSWLCLVVRTEKEFRALVEALGGGELQSDPRFSDAAARQRHDAELIEELTSRLATRSAYEWEGLLSAASVGAAAVSMEGHPTFMSYDQGLRESELTVAYQHPRFGELVRWTAPVSLSGRQTRIAPPCARGEHNRSLLVELGYDDGQIAELEARAVVYPASTPAG